MPSKSEKLSPAQERRLREAAAEEEAAMDDNRAMIREHTQRMARIESIVEALLTARLDSGLSAAEVARRMGVDRSALHRLENASHSPTLTTLLAYAEAIGVDVRIAVVDRKSGEAVPTQADAA